MSENDFLRVEANDCPMSSCAADELSHGTINTVLAKSDLELGIEALMREMQP